MTLLVGARIAGLALGVSLLVATPSPGLIVDNDSVIGGYFDQVVTLQGGLFDETETMDSATFVLIIHQGLLNARVGARGLGDSTHPAGWGADASPPGSAPRGILLWCQDDCVEHRPTISSLDIHADGSGSAAGFDDDLGLITFSWNAMRTSPSPNFMGCWMTGLIGGTWYTETQTKLYGGQGWRTDWDGSIGLYQSYPQIRCPGEASKGATGDIEVYWSENSPL